MWFIRFIQGAIARVWFGADGLPKFFQNRLVQTIYMLALFVLCFYRLNLTWIGWAVVIVVSLWLQFQFWSRGHGPAIDTGDDEKPSEDTIRRYNDRWYGKVCNWLFDKVFKKPERKYGFLYDFCWLSLRYTCPMLLMVLLSGTYALVGISIPFIYVFCNTLQKEEPWVFNCDKWYWRRSWSLAEILSGGIVYSSCYLIGLGEKYVEWFFI